MTTASLPRPAALADRRTAGAVAADVVTVVVAVAVLVPLSLSDGGYWPTNWGWTALVLAWVAAVAVLLRSAIQIHPRELVLPGALLALAGWAAASALWGPSTARPVLESERLLVYVTACSAALFLIRSRSYRGVLGGVWGSIALVATYSLTTRLFPERLGVFDPLAGYRLAEPIGYWNGLGFFAALGVLLAAGLAARAHTHVVRALAAASLVVLVPTLYFTFSRGAWIALGIGLLAWLALERRRLQAITTLVAVAAWPALGVWSASRSDALTRVDASLSAASRAGHELAAVLAALAVAAALAALSVAVLERRVRFGRIARVAYAAVLAVTAAAALLGVFARYGPPAALARDAYDAFRVPKPPAGASLNERLFSLSGNGRDLQWEVAWEAYERHPFLGSGAGSYEQAWLQHRPVPARVLDAHSLYLEVLAELGPVGLVLLLSALGIPLLAAASGRRRSMVPPAFGAYVAYLAHAGIDWDWELPAVTVAALLCGVALLAAGRTRPGPPFSRPFRAGAFALTIALAAAALVMLVGNRAVAEGEIAAASGDWHETEASARKATRWAPWSADAWWLLAQAQRARGNTAGARTSIRRAIDRDRENWELWYDLALASEGKAKRHAIARAVELNPLGAEALDLRAELGGDRPDRTTGRRP